MSSTNDFEFSVGEHQFQSSKEDGVTQGLMLKRVLPLIPPLIPLYYEANANGGKTEMERLVTLAAPFANAIASVKDDDFVWLIGMCCRRVKYKQGEHWAAFWNPQANKSMFNNLSDISILLPIVSQVLQENLRPFFHGMLTGQGLPTAPTSATPT